MLQSGPLFLVSPISIRIKPIDHSSDKSVIQYVVLDSWLMIDSCATIVTEKKIEPVKQSIIRVSLPAISVPIRPKCLAH